LQKMAGLHNRRMDQARIGTTIENPNIDFAKLAQSMGVFAEGPITSPSDVGPALSKALAVVKRGEAALGDEVCTGREGGNIVRVLLTALLIGSASTALAQENPPAGSVESGYQAYMKYQCYTCHGTVGQGADRGTGPRLAPKPISYSTYVIQLRTPRQDMPAY